MQSNEVTSLIAVGEAMVMITPEQAEPLDRADLVRLTVGGAEANVAAHAARLGVTSGWVSAVGEEALGRRVIGYMQGKGVDTTWVKIDPKSQTGVYFKDPGRGVLYYRKESAASRMTTDDVASAPFEEAQIVHLSGITPALSESCNRMTSEIITRVHRTSGTISFDVNHRPALWSATDASSRLLDLSRLSDIVFVGLDEAEVLWGTSAADDVRALLPDVATLVVKDGSYGAHEYTRGSGVDEHMFVEAIPTAVVEPIGAGDAFAAGYLTGRLAGEGSRARLQSGHRVAHGVLQSTSDFLPDELLGQD